MTEITGYMTDPEPAETVAKETTRPPLVPRKPPVQQTPDSGSSSTIRPPNFFRAFSDSGVPSLVPVSQQEYSVPARTSSSGNPVNGKISLPPVITSGLVANPVRGSSNVAVPISYLTTASSPATVIPSSSVQVPATVTTVTTDQQAAVSAPNRTQEQPTIPVSTTTPAVATTTREGGARYTQEYLKDVKGKQLEEPAMVRNLENDQDYWIRAQRTDSIGRPWLQQAQTPGAGASRPHSGCTRERQASGGELPGDTPTTAIDPEETNSPPKAAPTTGS
ncbi:hypothetical protein R1sor_005922 [Riccia sorocarpa]|uniref:SH3 domain-containing protein n=1 Tax=Riccia sorocarpa TaxID=122646 RepID=A0ABD3HNA6_9MARC